ncbi:MAG: ABC transporter permease [Candidatus Competibacterales bacterium]
MAGLILRRLGLGCAIIAAAVTLIFAMIHAVPGDPVAVILGPRASPELQLALREKMGLDQPLPVQLGRFFLQILQGDLGTDVFTNRSVADQVFAVLPNTLLLIAAAIGWAAAVGIPLGAYAALHPNTLLDRLTAVVSVSTIAVPSFVVALYALLLFAVQLQWFPAIGSGEGWLGRLHHLVLPAFAVGLAWVGYIARMVRASTLEVLGENFVRTARSFGLPPAMVVRRYVLRVAILPTVTLLGVGIGSLLSSAVITEIVFARPGLGKLIYDSVIERNYPVVMGAVLVSTGLFVVTMIVADLINATLDPRVRENA